MLACGLLMKIKVSFVLIVFSWCIYFIIIRRSGSIYINPPIALYNHRIVSYDETNLNRLVSYPWPHDSNCSNYSVRFAQEGRLPLITLTSFPGSGVTWLRQLIEGASGIYTTTIYRGEAAILQKEHYGNYADPKCRCTILQKNHEATVARNITEYLHLLHNQKYSRIIADTNYTGILLLRNPVHASFAYRHYLLAGQTGVAGEQYFQGDDWNEFLRFVSFAWADHAIRWIDQLKNGAVVFYEKLQNDTEMEIRRLLHSIHFNAVDSQRLQCTISHKQRIDRRRIQRYKIPLSEQQKSTFMSAIAKVQRSLANSKWALENELDMYKEQLTNYDNY